jgi:hypothetical protein
VAPKKAGKYTSVFVSRLDETTTSEDVMTELSQNGVIIDHLECEKLKTKYPGYASYRIHGRCEDPDVLLRPDMWDEGVFVKWYKVKQQTPPSAHALDAENNTGLG